MKIMETVFVLTQQMEFATKVLPSLFHDTPKDFLRFLNNDGNNFLRFYWELAGKNQQVSERKSPLGLNYDIRKPDSNTTIALVILPKPSLALETYFVALIFRPLRTTMFWGASDKTKVITLDLAINSEGSAFTQLRDWSKDLKGEVISNGPEPNLGNFYLTITELFR